MQARTRVEIPGPATHPRRRFVSPTSEGDADVWAPPMPKAAREGLERALCGVLARRYPGQRFAMKRQLDTPSKRPTAAGDADGLEDAA